MGARLGFLGFGEAAAAIAAGLRDDGGLSGIVAFDAAADDPRRAAALSRRAVAAGVALCDRPAALAAEADVVFALVTADVARAAAASLVPHLGPQHIYVDGNSASPATMEAVAEVIAPSGAGFVDAALMAAVPARRHGVPMLLAGPAAPELVRRLAGLGMSLEIVGDRPGQASAVKLCRSLLVKGVEAVVWECALVAEAHGATERVFAGAGDALGGADWRALAGYLMSRTALHGERRAHELVEAAETASAAGVKPVVATAAAERLLAAASLRLDERFDGDAPSDLDALLAGLREAAQEVDR